MHDNFEREVQKKMEELNLTPSVPVWEKIELQIRPEKRKRRMLVWLFLGVLLLSSGIFSYQFFLSSDKSSSSDSQQIATAEPKPNSQLSTTPTDKLVEKKDTSVTTNETVPTTPAATVPQRTTSTDISKSAALFNPGKTATIRKKDANFHKRSQTYFKETDHTSKATIDPTAQNTTADKKVIPTEKKDLPQGSFNQIPAAATADTNKLEQKTDSVKSLTPERTNPVTIDSSVHKKAASNTKWKQRIFFGAGISDQVASLSTTKAVMDAMPQNSGGLGSGSGGPAFSPRPAEINSGVSFMVGYEITRKLSDHFEFSIGLRYAYYSTKLSVGDSRRSDTAVRYGAGNFTTGQYYTNVGRSDFTNRFHTLQVPVTIHYKPSVKMPLYVAAGASYGQVISTNALTYSTGSNLYYRNSNNDVRSLLPVHASVQVGLFEKSKSSFRIGPAIQYNLLKSQKENSTNASHLFFAGLQSTINF